MGLFSRVKEWDDGDTLTEPDLEAEFDNIYDSVVAGTTTAVGMVQLEDSHASTSITKAACPKNVKEAYDLADSAVFPTGTPIDDDYAKFTDAATIEGRSKAEMLSDLNVADGADVTADNETSHATVVVDADIGTTVAATGANGDITSMTGLSVGGIPAVKIAGSVQNNQTGTTYTLVIGDAFKLITLGNAAAIAVTIPTNAAVAFPVGTQIDCVQILAGKPTFSGAGVTINSKGGHKAISGQWVGVTLIKTATDTWLLLGGLIA